MSTRLESQIDQTQWVLRGDEPRPEDADSVRRIVAATGFFNPEEVATAGELVEERLARGEASGYSFLFADIDGETVAYSCFGRIPFTASSFDLYWIAVDPRLQGRGLGAKLLAASEDAIRQMGGTRVYVETSTRSQYTPTRAFYERCAYRLEVCLEGFYAPGDGKAIFCKVLVG